MDIRAILMQIGYPRKQAIVYMATLELGIAPVSVIARKAKLLRSTTLSVLQKLSERGIAEYYLRKRTRYYSVIHPKALYEHHHIALEEWKDALPQITAISNQIVHKPKITFYEGHADLKRLYLDILTSKSEILNYFQPDTTLRYFPEKWFRQNALSERIKRKIPARVIMPDSSRSRAFLQRAKSELRNARLMRDSSSYFKNEVFIYDNKVSTFSFDEDFAFLIESNDVAETQRTIFNLAWNSAGLSESHSS